MILRNVFFIVEAVRALAEEAGSLEAVGLRGLPRSVVSGGVSAVVQRRLGRVPEWARPLLGVAAVAGRQVDLAVCRLLAQGGAGVEAWLQVCLEAAVLEVTDSQWRFAHDKLREALLAALSEDERRRLHRQVGEAGEQVYGQSAAHAAGLAFHFEQAGDLPKAARFMAQAGAAALRRGALQEAVSRLQRAEVLQEQTAAPVLERTATLRRLVRAYYGVDRRPECIASLKKGMALLGRPIPATMPGRLLALLKETGVELRSRIFGATATGDAIERAMAREIVALSQGTTDALFGRYDELLLVTLLALHAAERSGDIGRQINYLSWLGYAAYTLPLHSLGRLYLRQAGKLLATQPTHMPRSDYQPFIGYLHHAEGRWQQSILAFSGWINESSSANDAPRLCLAYCNRCSLFIVCGRLQEAIVDAQECEQLARRLGNDNYLGAGMAYRAGVFLYRGDITHACELFRSAQAHLEQGHNVVGQQTAGAFWSLAALRAGQPDLAVEQLDKALGRMATAQVPSPNYMDGYCAAVEVALHLYLSSATASVQVQANARRRMLAAFYYLVRFAGKFSIGWARVLLTLGRLLLARGQQRLARRALLQSLHMAEQYHMPYEQALAHLWLGRLTARTPHAPDSREPQPLSARAHLLAAEQLLSSSGYHLDLPSVQHELSLLDSARSADRAGGSIR